LADFLLTNFQREGVSADPFGYKFFGRNCTMVIFAMVVVAFSVDEVIDTDGFSFYFGN